MTKDFAIARAGELAREFLVDGVGDAAIAEALVAMARRGETAEEIVGFASVLLELAPDLGLGAIAGLIDTCGTGGAPRSIFNVSTAAAFVAAGAGAPVAKHGNRTSTSRCGSADVLEALGVDLTLPVARLRECLLATGIVFLFAPLLHTAVRRVMPVRRGLKSPTIFNLLGPLVSPARARRQVIGVHSPAVMDAMAEAALALGAIHTFVVHSEDGLGEFSTSAPTLVAEVHAGAIRRWVLDARDLGLARAQLEALNGGDASDNAALLRAVLDGHAGPARDIVVLNAAAALVAGGQAKDFAAGIAHARAAIDGGAARAKLKALVAFTRGNPAPTLSGATAQ